MAKGIKYTNEEQNVKYTNLIKPQVTTGFAIGVQQYKIQNNELQEYPLPIINATDINWGGAEIGETTINRTDDLIELLNSGNIGGDSDISGNKMIGIMLSAIRALQSEVLRLKNSFRFGINSYNEDAFGMSETVADLADTEEEEPLWATDETELSFIEGLDLSQETYDALSPISNFSILTNNRLKYTGPLTFTVREGSEGKTILEEIPDAKIYTYITCTNKDIDIILTSGEKTITINPANLIQYEYKPEKYNILLIVCRKLKDDNDKVIGKNFIWLSISEWGSGMSLLNAYINPDGTINTQTPETPIYNDDIYNISEIQFKTDSEDYIYKLDLYSKYQDFTKTVEASVPTYDEDYKYRTAALTIRSMSTYEKLQAHLHELQNNELVFCESNKNLYIYTNGNLINIGKGGSGDQSGEQDIMENYEILKALEEQGVINITFIDENEINPALKYDNSNIKEYTLSPKFNINDNLNNIGTVNFINGDTGKEFKVTMSPYGEFNIQEKHVSTISEKNGTVTITRNISSMQEYLTKPDGTSWLDLLPDDYHSDRGFVSLIKLKKNNIAATGDLGLNGDHIEIGAIYAPTKTDKIHGCTHGYIELFNASDEDFYLDGCYLHYSYTDDRTVTQKSQVQYYNLALTGYIPAGGTYLIRCKKYAEPDDPNVFINVKTYDIEWYISENELLDLSIASTGGLSLALTYDNKLRNGTLIDQATNFTKPVPAGAKNNVDGYILSGGTDPLVLISTLIDSKCIGGDWGSGGDHWVPANSDIYKARVFSTISSNTIYKVTFELDPAKQAYNSMTTKDSSRRRWANANNDQQLLSLNREFIEFPKTKLVKAVADYTPKASFEHKNVITDKSKLDKTKPNAIVCSYGINPYTTRCFNWVSSGLFNEAVIIIDPITNKEYKFESYTTISKKNTQSTDTIHRKEFPVDINNTVYARIYNKFPGNNEPYTSHKCIIEINNNVTEPQTYQYYIARLDSNNFIDNNYKSELRSFTIYPKTYQPRVYQITDQQGFHWVEYQVWTAAAQVVNQKIIDDQNEPNSHIMPIIINTGDCVQSGARVNEWLDYFNAGDSLFKHYEQNNIVGNNDLCDTNINALGTGDDTGKSNGYFFHLFNCYEIPTDKYAPICRHYYEDPGIYIPSLYYIDLDYISGQDENSEDIHKYTRILFINSEITETNCREWFNLTNDDKTINIYTGFTINASNQVYSMYKQYTEDEANSYNAKLPGAWSTSTINPNILIYYTQEECIEYNAKLPGAVSTKDINPKTETNYTEDDANAANANLDGAISTTMVNPNKHTYYEEGECITHNSTLTGAVSAQDEFKPFYPVYEILYHWTEDSDKTYLPVCHEMPFTVITNACLSWRSSSNEYSKFRSLSDKSKLIGSHTNQISDKESGKGMHWMSRLFEYRNITLCLGGHKHTYACTYPARENYLYTLTSEAANILNTAHLIKDENDKYPGDENYITTYDSEWTEAHEGDKKWSYLNGAMDMPSSLKDDTATWIVTGAFVPDSSGENIQEISKSQNITINLSKFPILKRQTKHKNLNIITSNKGTIKVLNDNSITILLSARMYSKVGEDEFIDYRFYPFIECQNDDNNTFVIYDMSQATGYKLTSNKELPSEDQKFSMIIPKTTTKFEGGSFTDTASGDQQSPMFSIIDVLGNNIYYVKVARIQNISSANNKMTFNQSKFGKSTAVIEYLCMSCSSINDYLYGIWCKYKGKDEDDNNIFIQTDVASSKTKLTYCKENTTEFKVTDNQNKILYPDLLTNTDIYLFKTNEMF